MKQGRFSSLIFWVAVVLLCKTIQTGICREEKEESMATMKLGGIQNLRSSQNSGEIESLARFAVQEHNKRENKILEFKKVVKAKEQVVAGTMYHLTLEANDGGQKKTFEAKVWVKPWMNFKQLQEFKPVGEGSSF